VAPNAATLTRDDALPPPEPSGKRFLKLPLNAI
jgi:hypothetical protein